MPANKKPVRQSVSIPAPNTELLRARFSALTKKLAESTEPTEHNEWQRLKEERARMTFVD